MFTLSHALYGQEDGQNCGYPLIQNFTSKQYLVAENINWAATQDELGNLYFANNNGVLKYDGNYWKLIETLKEVLSISYDSLSKRVYVGCIADFGYINVESSGKIAYQSLAQQIDKKDKVGKVWDCLSTPDGIYFNAEKELIRYKNGTFKTWPSKSYFHAVFYAGGKILMREAGTGLLCIENDNLSFVQGSETFGENIISYIGSIKNKPNQFVLASRNKGFFKFELTKLNNEFSIKLNLINKNTIDLFNKNFIVSGTRLKDNQYAISTMLGGLFIIDENGLIDEVISDVKTKDHTNQILK